MNIAIVGVGGVGGYFGGLLARAAKDIPGLKVYFIARGQHLEEIKKNGLIIDTDDGQFICVPEMATDDIAALPDIDLFLLCVKSYSLPQVLEKMKSKVKDATLILPLLNGMDIYDRVRAVIDKGTVFPSCVYVGTHLEKPGKIKQRGGTAKIIFGKDPKNPELPRELLSLFDSAGIKYSWTDDINAEIWKKYIFIAAFGLVTAASGKTLGEVLGSPELKGSVEKIMREITGIASKLGIKLPGSIIEDTLKNAAGFPPDTKTSFQRDFEIEGKPDERDIFGGAVIRLGKKTGMPTLETERVFALLQAHKKL